jgi:hypothetical protein
MERTQLLEIKLECSYMAEFFILRIVSLIKKISFNKYFLEVM